MPTAIRPSGTENSGWSAPGQGAAGEGDAEGAGAVVGALGDVHDPVHGVAGFGGGGGHLEDGEVPGDAAAFGALGERRRRRRRR